MYREERWASEGIQIGGLRSGRGVLGNWFDKDYDPRGPVGPTAFWKTSNDIDDPPESSDDSDDDDGDHNDDGDAGGVPEAKPESEKVKAVSGNTIVTVVELADPNAQDDDTSVADVELW
jgi:hypothetical protein